MAIAGPTYCIQVELNVPVPMRDSIILRADVYRPQVEGQHPVLVGRVGYKLRDWAVDFYTPTGKC
jgi:predicted acyl esterase